MNSAFVKHLLYPLQERMLGRPTFAFLRELEAGQWLPREALCEIQRRKLSLLLEHAWWHCPFYRRRFEQAGLDPRSVTGPDNLAALPLLTKSDIRQFGHEFTWPHVPRGPQRYSTGGSTGEPLVFYFDRRRQAYDQAARMRTHRWFGADIGQPEVYLWGSPVELNRQNRIRRFRDRLLNCLMLDAFDMSASRMDEYLRRIADFNPVSLFGYPSSLALLARRARRTGLAVRLPRLRAVFVTGETLIQNDRHEIESYFQVSTANCYGSREAGFLAHQCPEGQLHVTDENVILEILDDRDKPVGAGERGRVVITHLDTFAMPFIRYATGDLARRAPDTNPCPCKRNLSVIQSVEGRKTDFLVSADGTVRHALSAIYVLRELDAIREYRIVQAADCAVTVEVVCADGLGTELRDLIACRLRMVLGDHTPVRVEEVDSIEPHASGKHRPVVSHAELAHTTPV